MTYWKGKTALITGAGYSVLSDGRCGSIGYGIATAYAKEGANLVITGRNVAKLAKASTGLKFWQFPRMCPQAQIMRPPCRMSFSKRSKNSERSMF